MIDFIRPSPNSVFNCHNRKGIKYITRLCLGLNRLRENKLKHSFQDTLNPFCSCGFDVEKSTHFFLYYPFLSNQRYTLLNVNDIDSSLTNTDDMILTHIILFGKASLDISANTLLLKGAPSGLRKFLANKSPLKMMRNVFYFTLKGLFARYFNFCFDFLVIYKNGLIRKTRLILKFMMSKPG